ncbi:MAG: M16 family metallopeptidase [Patescibacteria group bacterium]
MEINRFQLKNGLQILHLPYKEVDSVTLSLKGFAGAVFEKENEIGVAHFLEHLVFDGTEKYQTSKKLDDVLDNVGGTSNAGTSKEYVEYWAKTLSQHKKLNFDYISQIVLHPLLRQKGIDKEKGVIEQEINRFKDSPEALSPRIAYKILFPNQRLGHFISGDIEDIMKIDKENINSFVNRTYNSNNFVLAVCGNIGLEETQDLAQSFFSNFKAGKKQTAETPKKSLKQESQTINKISLNQATLQLDYYGYDYNQSKKYALAVLSNIIGTGFSSRLFQLIRERNSLVYHIGSYLSVGTNYGVFSIFAGLDEQNIDKTIDLINKEFKKIVKNGITAKELQKAKNTVKASFSFGFESASTRASYYSNLALFQPNIKSHLEELESYEKVTLDEVKSVAKEILEQMPKITVIAPNFKKTNQR